MCQGRITAEGALHREKGGGFQRVFLKVKTSEEVFDALQRFGPCGEEKVSIEDALGRVLSRNFVSPEDLPGFFRSSMDGYAVKARDTFGASEALPALLDLSGEVVMGQSHAEAVLRGRAVRISTGGMLPDGADGVVMLEYCRLLDESTVEVSRAISPLENVIRPDDDLKMGDTVYQQGFVLRPQDLGVFAGLGTSQVSVYKRPKVAIISTGDEVVSIDQEPGQGRIRDINSYTLSAFCRQAGGVPIMLGICPDSLSRIRAMVGHGLEMADTVWISGGSSVGSRDMTLRVFESFEGMELLVHGISISPGKPTIIAGIGSRAVFGLPGHTTSAMVVAEVFLRPFLSLLSGRGIGGDLPEEIDAELSRNIESASGREDYIRVRLYKRDEKVIAEPVFGKSGLISPLVEADGLLRVERDTEGVYQGQLVRVRVFDGHRPRLGR